MKPDGGWQPECQALPNLTPPKTCGAKVGERGISRHSVWPPLVPGLFFGLWMPPPAPILPGIALFRLVDSTRIMFHVKRITLRVVSDYPI